MVVVKVTVPGPETWDQRYPDIHETSPLAVIFITVPVFTILSAGIVSRGAVLSILYVCTPEVIFPALSLTQAYTYQVPSVVSTGTVLDPPLQY